MRNPSNDAGPPPDRHDDRLLWIAVDFDNTLATTIWPQEGIGEPIESSIEKCHELVKNGYKIVIHTSRPWMDYEAIEWWLTKHDVPFSRIVCGKLMAKAYVDDRNIDMNAESWLP